MGGVKSGKGAGWMVCRRDILKAHNILKCKCLYVSYHVQRIFADKNEKYIGSSMQKDCFLYICHLCYGALCLYFHIIIK